MAQQLRAIRGGKADERQENTLIDYSLIFTVLFLLGFGLVMIYSVSSYEAALQFDDSSYYFKRQLINTIVGLVAMTIVALIPYRLWQRFLVLAYIVSLVLILLVQTSLGITANGATRWLNLGVSLQPAEVAKLGMIVFLAGLINKIGGQIRTPRGFLVALLTPAPIAVCIWKITDNLSSAIIVMAISFIMVFVADPDYKKFLAIAAAVAVFATLYVMYVMHAAENGTLSGFRNQRILAWLNPEAYASGKGFQTLQALYAIGSGGIFGKGLGESIQKLGYVPEAQNDMIFSIICEELGLFGGFAVILLFILLIWRCMIIAQNAPDLFGALLVVGVIAHISVQVILNIAVCTNMIPNTGISLPFISYGGSSVVFLLIEIGLVLSVGRSIYFRDLS
ncbi:MAG: putative lipid II flippase FtsW [Lachnospiraceae bacterium]|nr:putative lipid II flippase FtsW [Lachnospiraceae bacterium]